MRGPQARGFTYLMLLWWVAIASVMLAALGQQWAFERRREREAEMVFRATEIQHALAAYHAVRVGGQPQAWPQSLEDLLADRRGPRLQRHLRRLWTDPLTGRADWGLVMEERPPERPSLGGGRGRLGGLQAQAATPPQAPPGIKGVYSQAPGMPIRGPQGIAGYAEWRFEATAGSSGP